MFLDYILSYVRRAEIAKKGGVCTGRREESQETSDRGELSHHKTTFSLAILLEVGVGDLLLKNKKMMQIRNIAEINRGKANKKPETKSSFLK